MSTTQKIAIAVTAILAISAFPEQAEACGECKRFKRGVIRPAVEDFKRETRNLGENTEEAVRESGRLARNQLETSKDALDAYAEQVGRDGNFLRAGYVMQREYVNGTTDNTVNALQQSSMLRTAAQVGAAAYGGPAALGPFNGMYVYKVTGNSGLAVKTAIVSGGSAYLTGQVATSLGATAGDIAGRAAVSGHIAGTANAAMGGKYEEGFALGATSSVALSTYQNLTGGSPDGRPSQGEPYSKSADFDVGKSDWSRPQVGIANPNPVGARPNWSDFTTEHSPYLRALSKAPGTNAGAIGHDIFAAKYAVTGPALQLTIPPLFVLSYQALGTQRDDRLLETALEERDKK